MSRHFEKAERTVDQLIGEFTRPGWSGRMEAALALISIASTEKNVLSALVRALRGRSSTQRELAAVVLGFLRPAATTAVPGLMEALHDESRGVRRRAATALGRMRAAAAVPDLVTAMGDADMAVQKAAALALEEISGGGVPLERLL